MFKFLNSQFLSPDVVDKQCSTISRDGFWSHHKVPPQNDKCEVVIPASESSNTSGININTGELNTAVFINKG